MTKAISKEEQKQVAFIILKAVHHLQTGKNKLASFLRGSHSTLVTENEMDRTVGYGALLWYDIPTIKGFIDQLGEMGFLKPYCVQTGAYSYPIIALSAAGQKALKDQMEIPLQIRKEIKPILIGASERETLALFQKWHKPAEIAKMRGMAVSTIFGHFHKLISVGEIQAQQCIAEDVIKKVLHVRRSFSQQPLLKELKQRLPEEITYEEIKAVLADKALKSGDDIND